MADDRSDDFEPGSSRRHAIVVRSVEEEYVWVREHFPGYRVTLQTLCLDADGLYDVLHIESKNGEARKLYFTLGWSSLEEKD